MDALLNEQARRTGRRGTRLTSDGLKRLAAHPWPGNLRELGNVLERATILAPGRELGPDVLDLPGRPAALVPRGEVPAPAPEVPAPLATLDDVQRTHIRRVLRLTSGRLYGRSGAAALLGLRPTTLQSRMKRLGVTRFDVS